MAHQQAAPPDYREVTGNTGSQSVVGAVPGPSMVSYQTAAGPIYVSTRKLQYMPVLS